VITSSKSSRTILLRLEDNDLLPEALAIGLEVEGITAGWLRASGVVADLEIRAGEDVRRVSGPVMAATIESSIVGGRDSIVLRGVFSRDSGASIETFAGELVRARVLTLDVVITALEEATVAPSPPERKAASPMAQAPAPAWSAAVDASARSPEPSPKPQPVLVRTDPMPVPPKIRRAETDVDQPFPDAGDVVEHFAFGRCEVVKSDGDRLHVKLARDGRIREIALEMLKVSAMDPVEGRKHFRLDRKL
jgi:predicted DNA-binding protein with PD1-like motif